eukprot:58425_1
MSSSTGRRRIQKLISHLKALNVNNEDNKATIDHIVYWCTDLKKSITKFEKLLGITPVISGRHLKWGSWNALFSLDNGTYFELLADDPNNEIQRSNQSLKSLVGRKENGWEGILNFMCRPPNKYKNKLKDYKQMIIKSTNFDYGIIFPGERKLPNKTMLKWELMRPTDANNKIYNEAQGILPTMIDWKLENNNHPSYTSPQGCKLLTLKCVHSKYDEMNKIFSAMNMENRFVFEKGETAGFVVTISCPNGIVTL